MLRRLPLLQALLLAFLLAGLQAFGLAHAAGHGFEAHHHHVAHGLAGDPCEGHAGEHDPAGDGDAVACSIDAVATQKGLLAPPPPVAPAHLVRAQVVAWPVAAEPALVHRGSSPPVRGPPSLG